MPILFTWLLSLRWSVLMFVGCLTPRQHACASQGQICSHNFTCCHTQIEAADPTFYLTQSQCTDTGPTSPSADPIIPGTGQGSTGVPFLSHWYDSIQEKSRCKRDSNPGSCALEAVALSTRPTRRFFQMAAQSAVARSEENDGGLLVSCQLIKGVLV